jgi:small-conductance mechanosensitive channel
MEPSQTIGNILIGLIQTTAILVWTVAAFRMSSTALDGLSRLADRVPWLDARTLPLFDNLNKILIFGISTYFILVAWDLDLSGWLASAGIMGIAVGFAAKDSLANLFGGLFVIMDAPYKIGDYINLDTGERGRVIRIGLRSTRLLTRDDVEITLPNAHIANAKVVNESGGPHEKTRIAITVGVAYGSDIDQVRGVLMAAAESVEHVVSDPEPRVRFVEMGDSALIFRIQGWIDEPSLRGICIDGLNTAVYKALGQAEIEIPFPQRVVHMAATPPTP